MSKARKTSKAKLAELKRENQLAASGASGNKIILAVGALLSAIHKAEPEEVREALTELQEFNDAWVVSGDGQDQLGKHTDGTLADVDITAAIKEGLECSPWAPEEET